MEAVAGSAEVRRPFGGVRSQPLEDLLVREAHLDLGGEQATEDEEMMALERESVGFRRPTERTGENVLDSPEDP